MFVGEETRLCQIIVVMFAKFVKPRFNISAAEVKRLAEEFVGSFGRK